MNRLKAWSSALFDRIWQSPHRTSVPMLASGDVLIDACGGGPRVPAFAMSPLIFSASFVPRRPRGREQFLNFLTALAVPGLVRNGWEARVARSMRAGREWLVMVREDVDRVSSSDIGLMVRALKAEGFGKACRGMVVEYRIVVGEVLYEDDEKKEMDKVENMVRQLRETVFLEYRRFKVVVEGLQWLDRTREGRKLIAEVAEVVLYMNALGRFSG